MGSTAERLPDSSGYPGEGWCGACAGVIADGGYCSRPEIGTMRAPKKIILPNES